MGILYIDEAGNSGLKDPNQPNLIYGGPYIEAQKWKSVMVEYDKLALKYKSLVYSKFNPPETMPKDFNRLSSEIEFFQNFNFHAKEIVNGKGLWGKLNKNQPFNLLGELVTIMTNLDIKFYAGILNKPKLLSESGSNKNEALVDFKTLLPIFFQGFETSNENTEYVVVIADGDIAEKEVLHQTLMTTKNCTPELLVKKAEINPFLQLADAGLWILQAYHRLDDGDQGAKSVHIRKLYEQLKPILSLYSY